MSIQLALSKFNHPCCTNSYNLWLVILTHYQNWKENEIHSYIGSILVLGLKFFLFKIFVVIAFWADTAVGVGSGWCHWKNTTILSIFTNGSCGPVYIAQ